MSRLDEQLSERFYRWERRGRGWQVFNEAVEPEPPFRPFTGHHLPVAPNLDDGCRPTVLSSFVQKLSQKLSSRPPPIPELPEPEDEPDPQLLFRDSLVELQTSLPANLNIPKEVFEQFLSNLADSDDVGHLFQFISDTIPGLSDSCRSEATLGGSLNGVSDRSQG